jgi:hypothetical protein
MYSHVKDICERNKVMAVKRKKDVSVVQEGTTPTVGHIRIQKETSEDP